MSKSPLGLTSYEDDENGFFLWKDCEIGGCQNQVCVWKSEKFCYPHSRLIEDLKEA